MENEIVSKALEYLSKTKETNYKIAQKTGISETAVGRYKNEKSKPTIANATLLVQYFEGILPNMSEANPLDHINFVQVPLIPISARAGYLSEYADQEYINELPTIPVIVDKHYKGKYRVFEVEGDSMDNGTRNAIYDKDKVLCREVQRHLWQSQLHYKDWFFVIVHRTEGIIIKQILEHDVEKCEIKCHSLNPMFEDFTVHLNDVAELYNVIKIVDRNTRI